MIESQQKFLTDLEYVMSTAGADFAAWVYSCASQLSDVTEYSLHRDKAAPGSQSSYADQMTATLTCGEKTFTQVFVKREQKPGGWLLKEDA